MEKGPTPEYRALEIVLEWSRLDSDGKGKPTLGVWRELWKTEPETPIPNWCGSLAAKLNNISQTPETSLARGAVGTYPSHRKSIGETLYHSGVLCNYVTLVFARHADHHPLRRR
jgi:hypothetical protein